MSLETSHEINSEHKEVHTDLYIALGKLEDRVTVLEAVQKYHEKEDILKRNIIKGVHFISENAEFFAAILMLFALNVYVWNRL